MVHTVALLSIVITTVYSAIVEVPISDSVDIKVPQIDNDQEILNLPDDNISTNTIDDSLDNDDIIEVVNNIIAEEDSMLQVYILSY